MRRNWVASSLFSSVPRAMVATAFLSVIGTLVVLTLIDQISLNIPTAIVTAGLTLFAALLTQTWLGERQHKRDVHMKLREQKTGQYDDFISYWMDMLILPESRAQWATGKVDQNQLIRDMNTLSKPMMLWASNDVVRAYSEFKSSTTKLVPGQVGSPEQLHRHMETLLLFEQIIFRIREDVGHDPSGSRQYDILSFFVNDLDELKDEKRR